MKSENTAERNRDREVNQKLIFCDGRARELGRDFNEFQSDRQTDTRVAIDNFSFPVDVSHPPHTRSRVFY